MFARRGPAPPSPPWSTSGEATIPSISELLDEAPGGGDDEGPPPRRHLYRARLTTFLITVLAVVVLAITAGLWVVATGAYDVAATEEHWPLTEWALGTLQHKSVAARAGPLPVALPEDSAALEHGFRHFHGMCVECHGAPGFDRGDSGRGLNPTPPRLEAEAGEWTDAELFWITKHGLRLAGMPAFGPTHSDEEIAAIVGFIRVMETMTEEEYAERVRLHQQTGGSQ